MSRNYKFETLQLHVGQEKPDSATGARAVPIYLTSSYVFNNSKHAEDRFGLRDAGNIYGRLTNPTQDVFEQRVAALEGGVGALATASGASAIYYAVIALAKAGDNIVAGNNIYGGTYNLFEHTLKNFGIEKKYDYGEPSGTAGRPMLEVLTKEGYHNVCAVVTRYFGGVLLGTGGLIRAYQGPLKEGLDNAKKAKVIEGVKQHFTV